jgi:hypothetical protein
MSDNNNNLKIDLLLKINDLEKRGVTLRRTLTIQESIENLIFEYQLLQKKYEKLCEGHYYKNLSYLKEMVKNMSNEPNKDIPYTDEQFEEDLKKWFAETKYKKNSNLK